MYPIYPVMALVAAIGLSSGVELVEHLFSVLLGKKVIPSPHDVDKSVGRSAAAAAMTTTASLSLYAMVVVSAALVTGRLLANAHNYGGKTSKQPDIFRVARNFILFIV
jgi:hypothetical protein